jgi:hypothetical protein
MIESSDFLITKMPLNHGAGHMPVPEFGTVATMQPRRQVLPQKRWKPDFDSSPSGS